jgi:hypothetical protein
VTKEIGAVKKPWYAFNKEMEERFLSIKVDNELQQIEREAAFGALLNEGCLNTIMRYLTPVLMKRYPNSGMRGYQQETSFSNQKLLDIIVVA